MADFARVGDRQTPRLSNQDSLLHQRLASSVEFHWRGGSAKPAHPLGVELYSGSELLGIWRSTALGFMCWACNEQRPDLKAWSLEEAYQRSLWLIVRHPRQSLQDARTEVAHGGG